MLSFGRVGVTVGRVSLPTSFAESTATGGGVAAFKLEERAGKWQLTPAWLSRDMDLA